MVIHPILKAPRDALGAGFLAPGLSTAAEAIRLARGQVGDPGAPNGAGPGEDVQPRDHSQPVITCWRYLLDDFVRIFFSGRFNF
jgi:hypothetical protein